MMAKTLLTAWLVTLLVVTAAMAALSAEQNDTHQEHLRLQLTAWQQRLSATAMDPGLYQAWNNATASWRILRQAPPAERQEAARQLALALQALERAWQMRQNAEDGERPFFYAIDTATRITT